MNKYVLFSPIGNSDPVRQAYDGPMLHIVRYYRPHTVYLFYTKEMVEKQDTIRESLAPFSVNIKEILTDITDPHDFGKFSTTFDDILTSIQQENTDSKILLNISSGTPQIKSSLCLEVVCSNLDLKPIQVITPIQKSNLNISHGGDIEDNIDDLMEDGKYLAKNRCLETNLLSFKRAMVKNDILALIKQFEYKAAYEKIMEYKSFFSKDCIELIRYALLRQNNAKEHIQSKWHNEFDFNKNRGVNLFSDFYCVLSNTALKGELSYFILLLKVVTESIAEIYVGDFTSKEAFEILDKYYIEKTEKPYVPHRYKEKGNWVATYNLEQYIAIMKSKNKSPSDINDFEKIESLIATRNRLAHELYRATDLDSSNILLVLKRLIQRTLGNKVKTESLNLFPLINEKIIETI